MIYTYYVGLDVHKKTISTAYALAESREDATYHDQCTGSIGLRDEGPPKARRKTQGRVSATQSLLRNGPHQLGNRPPFNQEESRMCPNVAVKN